MDEPKNETTQTEPLGRGSQSAEETYNAIMGSVGRACKAIEPIYEAFQKLAEQTMVNWARGMAPFYSTLKRRLKRTYRIFTWSPRHMRQFERKQARERFQAGIRAQRRAGRGIVKRELISPEEYRDFMNRAEEHPEEYL